MPEKIVVPGEFLATEEEFSAGKDTFEEDSSIFSEAQGKPVFDSETKEVKVKKRREFSLLDANSTVLGQIMLVKKSTALVAIAEAEKNNEERVFGESYATLPVRNVSGGYVRDLQECFKIGDIIRAKVASVTSYSIDLRTNEPELGVLKAFCSKCRRLLCGFGRELKCTNCGSTEHRKMAVK